jgi:hypothetical protein
VLSEAELQAASEVTAGFHRPGRPAAGLAASWRWARRKAIEPHVLLVIVCLLHALAAFVFVVTHHMWWEQDETVYLSQVAAHGPALHFTPPRARGMPVLLYPVAHFTLRLAVLRSYLIGLGTVGMYVGFRPWLRLGLGRVVPAAALLLSSLWVSTFFGAETQPNFIEAVLCLAATGYFLVSLRAKSGWTAPVMCAGLLALAGLVRPSDASWLAGVLVFAAFMVKAPSRRRRAVVCAAVVGGLGLGWSEWVIEAFVSYGGFFHRLHEANALNTPGIHFSLLTQATAVNGPTLCRPCTGRPLSVTHIDWWLAIPPLVVLGLLRARRSRRLAPITLATFAGAALLLEYVLTVSYAAPRFLLPAYALMSLPCAAGIAAIARWRQRTWVGAVLALAIAGALGAQIASQGDYLRQNVAQAVSARGSYQTAARQLAAAGVRAPCVVYGSHGPPVGFALGCSDEPVPPAGFTQGISPATVVALTRFADGRRAYPGWPQVPLYSPLHRNWLAHILPADTRLH